MSLLLRRIEEILNNDFTNVLDKMYYQKPL